MALQYSIQFNSIQFFYCVGKHPMAYIQFAITFISLKYTGDRQFEKSVQYISIYNSGTCRY